MEKKPLLDASAPNPPTSPFEEAQNMELAAIRVDMTAGNTFQINNGAVESHAPVITTVRKRRRKRWLSKKFTNRLLVLTLVWQILNVGILTLVDKSLADDDTVAHPTHSAGFVGGIAVMVFFQSVHLIIVVIASIKLAKQVLHHTASNSFLIQSYLSTVLLYAGVYTLLHRLDFKSFEGMDEHLEEVKSETYITLSFIKLLYFSVATMTGTGFGDIHSGKWYMDLVISTQMLLSVVYTTTIFARGISVLGANVPFLEQAHHKHPERRRRPSGAAVRSNTWFKPKQTKAQAVGKLSMSPGAFVVHASTLAAQGTTLTVYDQDSIISYEITRTSKGYQLGRHPEQPTLQALVDYFAQERRPPLTCKLKA
eukprot:TRINITY_DN11145_c0_g1_i4.p1 TRINITY_DN11145_c0_g1~~TRINITY_DN11145_c0_g1_i4.p1  ORF type:complete len:367 (+),score=73.01 TRINITY_DN11145_c0_g1_i4:31-1131(+)